VVDREAEVNEVDDAFGVDVTTKRKNVVDDSVDQIRQTVTITQLQKN